MKLNLRWIVGSVLILLVLFFVPFVWRVWMPYGRYGMMRGYGYPVPMMYDGFGMMSFGILFMWLIPLGLLILIALGIVWLVKKLTKA